MRARRAWCAPTRPCTAPAAFRSPTSGRSSPPFVEQAELSSGGSRLFVEAREDRVEGLEPFADPEAVAQVCVGVGEQDDPVRALAAPEHLRAHARRLAGV